MVASFLISMPQSKLEQIVPLGFYGNLKEPLRHAIPHVPSAACDMAAVSLTSTRNSAKE